MLHSLFATVALLLASSGLALGVTVAPPCSCCQACVCESCQCDELGCACNDGGDCACEDACCAGCCSK